MTSSSKFTEELKAIDNYDASGKMEPASYNLEFTVNHAEFKK